MGDMQEKQAALQEKLAQIEVEESIDNGAVIIKANALRQILNVSIDSNKLDLSDTEHLEDLLLTAMNRILEKAATREASESKKMINDLMPPGMMDGLFG